MRFICSTLLLLFLSFPLVAQVELESERDSEGNVTIYATNAEFIPYSVLINFSLLSNLSSSGGNVVTAVAPPGRHTVAKLRPTLEGQSTNFRYSYSYAKGNILGKNKLEPIYLVPVREGEKVKAMQMEHIENRLGPDSSNDEYVGVSFRFEEPTAVVAPRKGVISDMVMNIAESKDNLYFADTENYIEIYHEDGSFTKLMVLKAGSQKVSLGDEVFPGQVLAESAGENYSSGPHVRMVVARTEKTEMDKFKYKVLPVKFATVEGAVEIPDLLEMEVIHPQDIIELEMTKREKKKYNTGN